ncbi:MAG TPA: hypothetical protein VGD64_16805 [Acidisarcina sp.]
MKSAALCLILLLGGSALCQQTSAPHTVLPNDQFLGSWKLNVQRSPHGPDREEISIQLEGANLKIADHSVLGNGTETDFWLITDPGGGFVRLTLKDGKPMNEEWRVTREGASSFIVDSRPFASQVRYEVSADGKTMSARRITSSIMGNTPWPSLVYDRVP